jgi:outer membrane protein OmpA-like peptidoglycan-associated protein
MKRLFFLLSFYGLLLLPVLPLMAQSQQAYLKAGEELLLQNDAPGALNYFREALEYGENTKVKMSIAKAELALFNYDAAEIWLLKCLADSSDKKERSAVLIMMADVNRRKGDFEKGIMHLQQGRKLSTADSLYYDQLLAGMQNARQRSVDTLNLEVQLLGGDINSGASDFSPAPLGDSLLFYSSMRFTQKASKERPAVSTSRILLAGLQKEALPRSLELPETINQASFNNANVSVSADGKVMVFCRCLYNEQNQLRCQIYESRNENGKWQNAQKLGDAVNKKEFTSTQPHIAVAGLEGYWLFFSSDQPGGLGKMDIWMAKRNAKGIYTKAVNAGAGVNSENDEWTPALDVESDTLYFSSERAEGSGALDLYAICFSKRDSSKAVCMPPPINSGYNDLYLNRSYGGSIPRRYLVSNRPPAATLKGYACCYDIFELKPASKKAETKDTLLATQKAMEVPETAFILMDRTEKAKHLKTTFPIRLYFDNDQPDPRSTSKSTRSSYDELAQNYLAREKDYLTKSSDSSLKSSLSVFFDDSVLSNLNRLDEFSRLLALTLKDPDTRVILRVEGTASPLADNAYNLTLSARRTSSIINYWQNRENGEIGQALREGRLKVEFVFSGEEKSSRQVSDRRDETERSVYSLDAALERRIEITDISINP